MRVGRSPARIPRRRHRVNASWWGHARAAADGRAGHDWLAEIAYKEAEVRAEACLRPRTVIPYNILIKLHIGPNLGAVSLSRSPRRSFGSGGANSSTTRRYRHGRQGVEAPAVIRRDLHHPFPCAQSALLDYDRGRGLAEIIQVDHGVAVRPPVHAEIGERLRLRQRANLHVCG